MISIIEHEVEKWHKLQGLEIKSANELYKYYLKNDLIFSARHIIHRTEVFFAVSLVISYIHGIYSSVSFMLT